MAFYMGAMAASEGSEFDRYKNIFDALVAGKKLVMMEMSG